jgi:tRNA (guanine37-N1)-methyltransferase
MKGKQANTNRPYRVIMVTLFPQFFETPLSTSLLGKAIKRGDLIVTMVNPRDYTSDRHRTVDDTPYGGGPGLVLKVEPLVGAIEAAKAQLKASEYARCPVVLLTPQGAQFSSERVIDLASMDGLIMICGRYEGIDERVREYVDLEISLGDFVLTGGEPAALAVLDSVSREIEGVLGNPESVKSESFRDGTLEYPQYTRPTEFRGLTVPDILLSGNHEMIAEWRQKESLKRTKVRRPDLFSKLMLDKTLDPMVQDLGPKSGQDGE